MRLIRLLLLQTAFTVSLQTTAQIDSTLLTAIKNCDSAVAKEVIKNKININAVDANRANALM